MAFVAIATSVGASVLGTGLAAGIGSTIVGGALIGAGVGGLYSAITGDGDILNSMLTGGLLGGAAGGIGGSMFPGAAGYAPASTAVASETAAAKLLGNAAVAEGATTAGMVEQKVANDLAAKELAKKAAGNTGMSALGYGLAGTTALSLLGSKQKGAGAGTLPDPGMIRPFDYASIQNQPTGLYPSPYATAQYNAAGNPVMDTRERNYFDQSFTAMQPYSAKTGTVNPNLTPEPISAASGGMLFDDENGMDDARGLMPGNMQKGLFGQGYAEGGETKGEESYKDRMKRIKDMTSMMDEIRDTGRVTAPDVGEYVPTMRDNKPSRFNVNAMPQGIIDNKNTKGVMGRLGASYDIDRDTRLFGGMSGFAGRDRGDYTVRPSAFDIGVAQRMGPGTLSAQYQRNLQRQPDRFMANYNIPFAEGGNVSTTRDNQSGLAGLFTSLGLGNTSNMPQSSYNPQQQKYAGMAVGGSTSHLGGYSDGGRMLKGPGDGMSDDIPGVIGNKQPARLADGEFVVPADVVSHLGNGSTDAGAKRLYAMMDQVRSARTGNKKQGKKIKADKYLPT